MVDFAVVEVPTETVAVMRRQVPLAGLPEFFGMAFGSVAAAVSAVGGTVGDRPFGWYFGMPTATVDVAAGFPLVGPVPEPGGEVVVQARPGGRAVVGVHVGPYDTMGATYQELEGWMAEHALVPRTDMWEEYLSAPEGDPATWQTRIVMPLA
jgi:effector-binding domain-containing protein